MARKTVPFNHEGISRLPRRSPVVYRIRSRSGVTDYVGSAKRGRVRDRLREHLAEGRIQGATVQIETKPGIAEARETEARVIARSKPKYNRKRR